MSLRPLSPMSSRSKVTTTVSLLLVLVGLGTFAVAEAQRPDGESTLAAMWDALVAEPARNAPPWAQRLMAFIANPQFVATQPAPARVVEESPVMRRERPIPVAPIDREDVYATDTGTDLVEVQPGDDLAVMTATSNRPRPAVDSVDPYGTELATAPTTTTASDAAPAPAARPRLIVSSIEETNPYL
jgi:hypothetical protein